MSTLSRLSVDFLEPLACVERLQLGECLECLRCAQNLDSSERKGCEQSRAPAVSRVFKVSGGAWGSEVSTLARACTMSKVRRVCLHYLGYIKGPIVWDAPAVLSVKGGSSACRVYNIRGLHTL